MKKLLFSDRFKLFFLICFALGIFIWMGPLPARACSVYPPNIDMDLDGISGLSTHSLDHLDGQDGTFKGWLGITVTNTGTKAWGDFHFGIYEVSGFGSVENVHFIVDPPYEPTSSQTGLTWVVDNVSVGATLDLYFYSDPVLPGETATFTVYTDNQDSLSYFGVSFYPTPVPIPGVFWLLSTGLIGLVGVRRQIKK